jgi:hypothetical protein
VCWRNLGTQVTHEKFAKAIKKATTVHACGKKIKTAVPLLSRLPPPAVAATYVAHLWSEGMSEPTNKEVKTALSAHIPEQTDRSITLDYLYNVRKAATQHARAKSLM